MKGSCGIICFGASTWMQEAAIEVQWREQKASDLREITNKYSSDIQSYVASAVLYLHVYRVLFMQAIAV